MPHGHYTGFASPRSDSERPRRKSSFENPSIACVVGAGDTDADMKAASDFPLGNPKP